MLNYINSLYKIQCDNDCVAAMYIESK